MSTSTDLDIDLALLVGEMEAPPCEHSQHGKKESHDEGPATYYLRSNCVCDAGEGTLYAACQGFVNHVLTGYPGRCTTCGNRAPINEMVIILGPINS